MSVREAKSAAARVEYIRQGVYASYDRSPLEREAHDAEAKLKRDARSKGSFMAPEPKRVSREVQPGEEVVNIWK